MERIFREVEVQVRKKELNSSVNIVSFNAIQNKSHKSWKSGDQIKFQNHLS